MPQRAKGITFDPSGFLQAAQNVARTGEIAGEGRAAMGAGIAKGLFGVSSAIGARKSREAQQAENAKDRALQQARFEAQLAMQQKRLAFDMGKEQTDTELAVERLRMAARSQEQATAVSNISIAQRGINDIMDFVRQAGKGKDPNSPEFQTAMTDAQKRIGALREVVSANWRQAGMPGEPTTTDTALITLVAARQDPTGLRKEKAKAITQAKMNLGGVDRLRALVDDKRIPSDERARIIRGHLDAVMNAPTREALDAILSDAASIARNVASQTKESREARRGVIDDLAEKAQGFRDKTKALEKEREEQLRLHQKAAEAAKAAVEIEAQDAYDTEMKQYKRDVIAWRKAVSDGEYDENDPNHPPPEEPKPWSIEKKMKRAEARWKASKDYRRELD